jgi:hypothetical protein
MISSGSPGRGLMLFTFLSEEGKTKLMKEQIFVEILATVIAVLSVYFVGGTGEAVAECKEIVDCANEAVGAAHRAEEAFNGLNGRLNAMGLVPVSASRNEASRNSPTDPNQTATGKCPKESVIVGYYCQIDSGGGNLQNAGISLDSNSYICTWNNVGGPFKAWGLAACLGLKK